MDGVVMCKVIIVSNPTAVEVILSCIEVVVGVLTTYTAQVYVKLVAGLNLGAGGSISTCEKPPLFYKH